MEEIEVRKIVGEHCDKVWIDVHIVMKHTRNGNQYDVVNVVKKYTRESLIHTSEDSVVMAKWISALSFGLKLVVDESDAFSSYRGKRKKKKKENELISHLSFLLFRLPMHSLYSNTDTHSYIYIPWCYDGWWRSSRKKKMKLSRANRILSFTFSRLLCIIITCQKCVRESIISVIVARYVLSRLSFNLLTDKR